MEEVEYAWLDEWFQQIYENYKKESHGNARNEYTVREMKNVFKNLINSQGKKHKETNKSEKIRAEDLRGMQKNQVI